MQLQLNLTYPTERVKYTSINTLTLYTREVRGVVEYYNLLLNMFCDLLPPQQCHPAALRAIVFVTIESLQLIGI